jgi:DNA-binding NtrC family response regulator
MEIPMSWPAQVLVIACESENRTKLEKILAECGCQVFCYATLLEAQSFLSGQSVEAIFAEMKFPDGDFQVLRSEVERFQPGIPIIALSPGSDWDSYLAAMASGAFDCLSLPAGGMEIKRVLWSALNAFSTERVAAGGKESVLSTR